MPQHLQGRVALVTGARRGIGAALAQRLAAAGAAVVLAAETLHDEGLDETLAFIRASGGKASPLAFDLSDAKAREGVIARASEAFGPIDILVNNAALNNYQPPSTMDLAFRRRLFDVNVHGPMDLIQQALPHMKAQHWGRIINLSSGARVQRPIPHGPQTHGIAVYAASKVALERLTAGLAVELHNTGVTVNAYFPTAVCVTGVNSATALAALRNDPGAAESVEMMAEAGLLLIQSTLTGLAMPSRQILFQLQAPLHALDGATILGDANTITSLGASA